MFFLKLRFYNSLSEHPMGLNIKLCALSSASAIFLFFFFRSLKRRSKLIDKLTDTKKKKSRSPSEIKEAFEKGDKNLGIETLNENEKRLRNTFVIGKSLKFNNQMHNDYIYHIKKTLHVFSNNKAKVKELLISSSPFKLIDLDAAVNNSHVFVSVHQNDKVECLIPTETLKDDYTPIKLSWIEKLGLFCSTTIFFIVDILKFPQPLKNIFVGITESEVAIKYGGQILVYGDVVYNLKEKTMKIEHPLKFLSNSMEVILSRIRTKIWKNDVKMIFFLSGSLICFYLARRSLKGNQRNKIQEKIKFMDKDKFITTQGKDFRCMICRNKQKNMILHPCSHLVMCKECVEKKKEKEHNCPLCKQEYTETIEILIP